MNIDEFGMNMKKHWKVRRWRKKNSCWRFTIKYNRLARDQKKQDKRHMGPNWDTL